MARSKAKSKARQKALGYPDPRERREKPHNLRLYSLLPRVGFDWMLVDGLHCTPDLRQEFSWGIVVAFKETYAGINTIRTKFDDAMAEVILRGTEMEDSVIDTDPIQFWTKVKESFQGTDSFVNHHRMTPQLLHAFVAYAIDARNASVDGPGMNRPLAEGNLVRAVDTLQNEFAHEPYAETRDAYFERQKDAGWILHYKAGEEKMDVDGETMDIDEEVDINGDTGTEEELEEDGGLEGEEELEDVEEKEHDNDNQHGEAMEGVEDDAETLQPDFKLVFRPRVG
ncbi:hypothetical protein CONLIGDRAFT_683138 [Coniochaeta ligniaria NRRL 30616]|uniref:Uncharacterized protein n=1 Tax=Coniochaeta ligniaria NRRL 30616 TaxID=1408157 RepID=A0A1J7JEL9_9PEZI|nr:hypothetical protein CONLIGDRAFT_683138 [Coniochaeta ligniaria NRRL 30616]